MEKRAYAGFTFEEFARLWPALERRQVFCLTDTAEKLHGEERDYAEWQAMMTAAASVADAAADTGQARIVVAADVEVENVAGLDTWVAFGTADLPAQAVASVHIDEQLRHTLSVDELLEADLLWYAPSEIGNLVSEFEA